MEVPAAAAGGVENKVTEIPAPENVRREWTGAACQVTTMCEKNFQSHLQRRKHEANFAAEEKEIQVKFLNAAPKIHEFYLFLLLNFSGLLLLVLLRLRGETHSSIGFRIWKEKIRCHF
ncbi:hypothetical protein CsSME_00009951 [Camellia sinensis var. sinensis]